MSVIVKKLKIRTIGLGVLALSLLVTFKVMYGQGEQQVQEHLRSALQEKSKFALQDLHMGMAYLEHQQEQFLVNYQLAQSGLLSHFSLDYLQDYPEYSVFSQSDRLANQSQSNITGLGSYQQLTIQSKHEIVAAMTLALSSLTNSPNFDYLWTYYTSKHQFMVLAPYVSVNDFRVKKRNFTGDIWQQAESASSAKNKIYYSSLYEDSAGQGYVITLSRPVYSDQGLLGFLSADMGIKQLKHALEVGKKQLNGEELTASSYIVNGDGVEIASLEAPMLDHHVVSKELLNESLKEMQNVVNGYLLAEPIIDGEFYSLLIINKTDYVVAVLQSIFEKVLIGLAFVFCLLSLYLLNKKLGKTRQMAGEDSLSKLYNRRTLMKLGSDVISKNQQTGSATGCLLLDIDHFKKINDNYGHNVGDEAIRFVSQLLKANFRKGDIIARYGGEEFVVILSEVSKYSLLNIAEKLRSEIEQAKMEDHPIDIRVSIGCSLSLASTVKLNELIKLADVQLYKAKENGRNRVECE